MSVAIGQDTAAGRKQALERIEADSRFVLVTHENPDGDALGSLVAMHGLLRALGKDAVMLLSSDDLPLPYEYRFFVLEDLIQEPPEDVAERTAIFLDCGNIDRIPPRLLQESAHLLNIDHHHDNTRFGTVNHVVASASCTAEIVWDLMKALDVSPTPRIAEALYVGLITDTGRFMYENTGPGAHEMAAELITMGVDVQGIYRRLFEDMPPAKLKLLAVALQHMRHFDQGALTLATLSADDFRGVDAEESYSEGVIDHLRAVQGTKVAALVREMLSGAERGRRKVSLRSTDCDVDVSAIARLQGGGGHRRAAGFSTALSDEQLISFLRLQIAAQLHLSRGDQRAPTPA